MVDLCHSMSLDCLNDGRCIVNIASNTTYCQCTRCHTGSLCEVDLIKVMQLRTDYIYLIIVIIALCSSVLNNVVSLEVFLGSRRVRRTNCGVYLIAYSVVSLLSNVVMVIDQALKYHLDQHPNGSVGYPAYGCYFGKIGYNMLVYLCIWLSSWVAFERSLIVCFGSKTNATRWRSLGVLIVFAALAIGMATPMIVYKCDWDRIPSLGIVRSFFSLFFIITGIVIYVLATLMVLISFTLRIKRYGTENGSFIKTFLQLLKTHLLIFLPPLAFGIGYIPYTIAYQMHNDGAYFECDISNAEIALRALAETLQRVPFVITWLLFVYPSRVHMNEYYISTWSGQRLARVLVFLQQKYQSNSRVGHTNRMAMNDRN